MVITKVWGLFVTQHYCGNKSCSWKDKKGNSPIQRQLCGLEKEDAACVKFNTSL